MRGNLKFTLELSHLILGLNQVFTVEVTIRSHSFVEILLLLELSFKFNVFFFKFTDEIFLEFHFFYHLHKVCVGFRSFVREFVTFFFKFVDAFREGVDVFYLLFYFFIEFVGF